MIIDLRRCAHQPLHVERRLDVGETFRSYRELEALPEVDVMLDIAADGRHRFRLRGRLRGAGRAYCVRCLEPVPMTVDREFRLTLMSRSQAPPEKGEEMGSETIDVVYFGDDQRLHVRPLIEEQVNLSLPMRFLCRPSCAGLCSVCGHNRNTEACDCPRAEPDERWQALAERREP